MNKKLDLRVINREDLTESVTKLVKLGASKEVICAHIEASIKNGIIGDLVEQGLPRNEAKQAYAEVAQQVKHMIAADVSLALSSVEDNKRASDTMHEFMVFAEEVLRGDHSVESMHENFFARLVTYFIARGASEKDAAQKAHLLCITVKKDFQEIESLARIDEEDDFVHEMV